jgi:hypothetical protein
MKWKIASLFVALAVVAFILLRSRSPMSNALRTRELATRGLAAHLAERFSGRCATVVSNPFTKQKGLPKNIYAQENAGLKGLQKGFGDRVTFSVTFPDLKEEARQNPFGIALPEGTTTPLSYLVAEGSFDKVAAARNCDLIVSLIGLPADVQKLALWQAGDNHVFALLLPDLRVVGDVTALRSAVQSGKIAAFVLNKPGAPPEQTPLSGDWKAEFEKRFILVSRDNFEQMLGRYPHNFAK